VKNEDYEIVGSVGRGEEDCDDAENA